MSENTKGQRRRSREGRLQAALRENLKRRKAQARGRQGDAADSEAAAPAEKKSESVDPKGES